MSLLQPLECPHCQSRDFYTSRRLPRSWHRVRWARTQRGRVVMVVAGADDLEVVEEASDVHCSTCHAAVPEVHDAAAPSEPRIVPGGRASRHPAPG